LSQQPQFVSPADISNIPFSSLPHFESALSDVQSGQVESLLKRITALEVELSQKNEEIFKFAMVKDELARTTASEQRLLSTVRGIEIKTIEYERLFKKLEPKWHEAQTNARLAEQAKEKSDSALEQMQKKLEARDKTIADLKDQLATTKSDLKIKSDELLSSAIPELADLELHRVEKAQIKAEREKLERLLASKTKDFEFTSMQYQKASSSAASLAKEVSELTAKNIVLARKADETRIKVAEIQKASDQRELEKMCVEFRDERDHLRTELERRERELIELRQVQRRGLRGGRSGSPLVAGQGGPMSPRMGVSNRTIPGASGGTQMSRSQSANASSAGTGTPIEPGGGTAGGSGQTQGLQHRWHHVLDN
jgi:chromosome segregation ATPase